MKNKIFIVFLILIFFGALLSLNFLPYKYKYCFDIYEAKKALADSYSVEVLEQAADFFVRKHKINPLEPHNYADFDGNHHPKVFIHKGDYVLEAGVSGDVYISTVPSLEQVSKEGKVFGVEPNPSSINKIKNDLKDYKNFQLFQYALSNKCGIGKFNFVGDPNEEVNLNGRLVLNDPIDEEDNIIDVELITIDKLLKDNNINKMDFILLDIEGAESRALQGAKETIKKYKPDLSISCHNLSEILKVILFIHSINKDYKIYFAEFDAGGDSDWRNYIVYASCR